MSGPRVIPGGLVVAIRVALVATFYAALLFPAAAAAQSGAPGGYGHSCADCHLRDHDMASGGRAESDSRLAARAIARLIPGLSIQSANCLECHATDEQRRRRAAERREDALPVTGGLYLGLVGVRSHPLGSERRAQDWLERTQARTRVFGSEWSSDDSRVLYPDEASINCDGCHAPHEYDLTVGVANDERTVCLACHQPTYYAFNAHVTPSCGDCHRQHNAPGPSLTREPDGDALCAACHEGSGRLAMTRPDASLQGPDTHPDLRPGRCSDCHKVHGDPGGG